MVLLDMYLIEYEVLGEQHLGGLGKCENHHRPQYQGQNIKGDNEERK